MNEEKTSASRGEITIKPTRDEIAACTVCLNRNYEPTHLPAPGKKIDTIYDLSFSSSGSGSIVIRLCAECLGRLWGEIPVALYGPEGTEKEGKQ